ncbi:MAG: helix-turn-helix transcriptional regulator [Rhodospirillales bacterium]|nr:helix-turn-helix transcriptional regulator [Rhodospirillales bacterium]
MTATPVAMAEIAAAIGVPARAAMLAALLDGRAQTAKELAHRAGIAAPTASLHLARLSEAGLLAIDRQGRHAYARLASPEVGHMLEALLALAAARDPAPARPWRGGAELRLARTCYDHLAGRLGVALTDRLAADGMVALGADGGEVTARGVAFLGEFGIAAASLTGGKRAFCRPCLDWSERRPHLAGALGAALAERCFALGWVARVRDSRAVAIGATGEAGFAARFGIDVGVLRAAP